MGDRLGTRPTSLSLYKRVKADVYKKMPKHSAYRSGHVVKQYKAAFVKKFGRRRSPYKTDRVRTRKRGTKGRIRSKSKGKSRGSKGKSKGKSRGSKGKSKGKSRSKRFRNFGLTRWFAEKWRNQRGEVGYKYKSDVYRPMMRVTKKTPITHGELTNREVRTARRMKASKGRVKKFRK